MTGRRMMSSSSGVPNGNPGRSLSRTELEHLVAHAKLQPPGRRRALTALADTPTGRARARTAGYTRKPPEAAQAGQQLAGVPVDVHRLLDGLRATERGRRALRARGLS